MPVASGDLVIYGSASMPDVLSTGVAPGGVIDYTTRMVFSDAALANDLNDTVTIQSSLNNDNFTDQKIWVIGRDSAGIIVSGAHDTAGTGLVNGTQNYQRILKIWSNMDHQGTISGYKTAGLSILAVMESGIRTLRRPFIDASADAAGGSTRNYYEKVFIRNNNMTWGLTNAIVSEQSDPSGIITFALDSGKHNSTTNDGVFSPNRLSAPSGHGGFQSQTNSGVPGTFLTTGEAIGVWLNMQLIAGLPARFSTYTLQIQGTST